MHNYAIFGHSRAAIGRWLGVSSIVLAGGISNFISWFNDLTGFQAFFGASITTGIVYFILHFIFDKYAWKIPFFKIPNLNGIWDVKGQTLDEEGNIKYEWNAKVDIEQTWENIIIYLKNESSSASQSYTATISKIPGTCSGWLLSYSYKNEPKAEQMHELNSHKGYCEIELDKDILTGEADYFNSNGRRTFGKMILKRNCQ